MVHLGQAGQEEQIGLERADFSQRRETPGSGAEYRRGVRKLDEGRLLNAADGAGIGLNSARSI
jgi:hypothetical protein